MPSARVSVTIVYFGSAGVGKTTNLERLARVYRPEVPPRLAPRVVGKNRVFAVDVPSDSFGWLTGLDVAIRATTVQAATIDDEIWKHLLSDASGVVFVAGSSPWDRADNTHALRKLRSVLSRLGRSVSPLPIVLQWNKRDLPDARPITELQNELNHEGFASVGATAIRGIGVTETFTEVLKRAAVAAYRASGAAPDAGAALERKISHTAATHIDATRGAPARTIPLSPGFQDPFERPRPAVREPSPLLAALERVAIALTAHDAPDGLEDILLVLLDGAGRAQGSIVRNVADGSREEDREAAIVVPIECAGVAFGRLVVYAAAAESPPDRLEVSYWKIAASLIGLYLSRTGP